MRGADGIYIKSEKLRAAGEALIGQDPGSRREKIAGQLFQYLEWAVTRLLPGSGEELLMVAVK